ncbi:DUF6077 domain-containing protein [Desulfogranum marinum]|uniref:DUF6077 domain-containing protein n=1 Tax=Desulfogranum marinum TaxID=453220 RepID=UPI0029C93E3D|nr:DUF6077 domain-containing protein [Desulfogranum marinum]
MSSRYIEIFSDLFFTAYGCFTLIGVIGYFVGLDFIALLIVSGICIVVIAFLAVYFCYRDEVWCRLPYTQFLCLGLFIVASVCLTLCLNRPDSDDRTYLGLSILILENPDIPIRAIISGLHKGYALSYYEFIKSSLTFITGVPILYSYYLVVPSIIAIMATIMQWRLLKLLVEDRWLVGMLFFFIVMLTWGDVHRTHANFGFVRMFQGKACFVTLVIPSIFYYFLKYQQAYRKRYAVFLVFVLLSGVGFTPTGIIVGPLSLLVLMLANISFSRDEMKRNFLLALSLLVPLGIGLVMKFYFGHTRSGVHTQYGVRFHAHTANYEMLRFVLGSGYRGWFSLFCFVVSPLFITNKSVKKSYRNFVALAVLMLAMPWTSEIIARATYPTASWRWLWMLPLTTSMSIVIGGIPGLLKSKRGVFVGYGLSVFLVLVFVFSSSRLVVSKENGTSFGKPAFKLPDSNRIWLDTHRKYAVVKGAKIYFKKSGKSF